MLSVDATFSGTLTREYLQYIGQSLENLRPLLERYVQYYRTVAQPEIFKAHGDGRNGGTGHPDWEPLSPRYLASARKRNSPHPTDMLQLTGAFRQDLTTGTAFTVEEYLIGQNRAEAVFGSTRDYPVWAGAGRGGPRQAMYITPKAKDDLTDMTNSFLSEIIRDERVRRRRGGRPSGNP